MTANHTLQLRVQFWINDDTSRITGTAHASFTAVPFHTQAKAEETYPLTGIEQKWVDKLSISSEHLQGLMQLFDRFIDNLNNNTMKGIF